MIISNPKYYLFGYSVDGQEVDHWKFDVFSDLIDFIHKEYNGTVYYFSVYMEMI